MSVIRKSSEGHRMYDRKGEKVYGKRKKNAIPADVQPER